MVRKKSDNKTEGWEEGEKTNQLMTTQNTSPVLLHLNPPLFPPLSLLCFPQMMHMFLLCLSINKPHAHLNETMAIGLNCLNIDIE